MIVLFSAIHQILISLPNNEELAVYCRDYFVDEDGTAFTEAPHNKVEIYGDIVIETTSKRYILENIHAAYDVTARLVNVLIAGRQQQKGDIYIDLDKLPGPEFTIIGGMRTEKL